MKHTFSFFAITIAMITTSGCASQHALTGDVKGITAKIDARVKAFHLDENAGGTIKMKRGEGIQLSLTKFGIEGVRVTCTPDSILVVNRLTKTYIRTSFKDADRALGGEGTVTFANFENYFWNDEHHSKDLSTLPIAGIIPLDIETTYGKSLRAGEYRIPQRINIKMSGADSVIEAGDVRLKMSKVKKANDWHPSTEVSSKYKNLNITSLIKSLLKK